MTPNCTENDHYFWPYPQAKDGVVVRPVCDDSYAHDPHQGCVGVIIPRPQRQKVRATGAIVDPETIPLARRQGLADRAILVAAEDWVRRIMDDPGLWGDDQDFALIRAVNESRELRGEPMYVWHGRSFTE